MNERKATFNKDTDILRICDWGKYYSFQVRFTGLIQAIQEWSNTLQACLDQLTKAKKNGDFADSKPEVIEHEDETQRMEEKSVVVWKYKTLKNKLQMKTLMWSPLIGLVMNHLKSKL